MTGDRILLVDDEREVGAAVMRDLRAWRIEEGLTLVYVDSAAKALEELERIPGGYSVVVSDLQMPGLKGNALLRVIYERWPETVCVVLTGNMQLEYVQDFIDCGVFSFVRKPWDRDRLILDLSNAVQLYNFRSGERQLRADTSMEISPARDFQVELFQYKLPEDPRLTIDIFREYGGTMDFRGDFLEVQRLDADRILIVLADVSEHGPQASFITSLLKTIMDAELSLVFDNRRLSAGVFAEWINRRLCSHLRSAKSISVALLVVEIDLRLDVCRWVNAGQPPFVSFSETGPVVASAASLPACVDEDAVYAEQELPFSAGSQLVLSTDGLFPGGLDVAGYGAKDYFDLIIASNARGLGARETAEELRARAGLTAPVDDLTLVRLVRNEVVNA